MSIPFLFCACLVSLMCGATIGIIALGLCVAGRDRRNESAESDDSEDWHLDTHA